MIPLMIVGIFVIAILLWAIHAGGISDLWEYLSGWTRRRPPPLISPSTIAQMERELLDTPVSEWVPVDLAGASHDHLIREVEALRAMEINVFGFDLYDGTVGEVAARLGRYYQRTNGR